MLTKKKKKINRKRDRPCVTRVFFEGEPQEGDLFPRDSVKKALDDPAGKPPPLVFIHVYHLNRRKGEKGGNASTFDRSWKKKNLNVAVSPAASRWRPRAG